MMPNEELKRFLPAETIKEKFGDFFSEFDLRSWLMIAIGSITWILTMVKSGLIYSFGMGFWGANGHDGIWHIALINSLSKGSWEIPVFAGNDIVNYHLGFDLFLAIIKKLSFVPSVNLYFQIAPVLIAIFAGILTYKFVTDWSNSRLSGLWSLFFLYFGGGIGWLIKFLRFGSFDAESMFWSQQAISTLINPPFALSLVFITSGLICLRKGIRTKNKKCLTAATFLFGSLIQIKVYAGVLVLAGLFAAAVVQIIKRKGLGLFKVFSGSFILSIILFSPTLRSNEIIKFQPFWFLESMFAYSDRVNWPKMAEALTNYRLGGVWHKAIPGYIFSITVFVLGNFSTRLLSIPWFTEKLKNIRSIDYIDIIFTSIIIGGIIAPLLFVQAGNPWNTIQFLYYSLVFSSILAGKWLGDHLTGKSLIYSVSLAFIIVILTIPTTIFSLKHYLPMRPPAMISKEELEALTFLSDQPDGVVLTQPFNKDAAKASENDPPRPLYLYESTAYVSAFSNKSIFIEDEVNLQITGYDWNDRRRRSIEFWESKDLDSINEFLNKNDISYLYYLKDPRIQYKNDLIPGNVIYESDLVKILSVKEL